MVEELKIPASTEVGFVAGLQLFAAAVLVLHCPLVETAVPEAEPVQFLGAANASELKQAKDPIATRATAAARAKRVGIRSREKRSERLMGGSAPRVKNRRAIDVRKRLWDRTTELRGF